MTRTKLVGAAILLGLALPVGTTPAEAQSRQTVKSGAVRQAVPLNQGWRFHFNDSGSNPGEEVLQSGFDDSSWKPVSVPHSWNRIGGYGAKPSEPGNWQGIGWYRLSVEAPAAAPGMRQYLDFAAVSKIAEVWVNEQRVGGHEGAFARFRLDVTDAWKPGQRNLIVVRADNSKVEPGSATSEVIPLAGDFFVHGGIYRDVSLLQLPPVSIDPLDYGGPGVYARATSLTDELATVEVRTRLRNFADGRKVRLLTQVIDAAGRTIAREERSLNVARGASEAKADLSIRSPHRWNGRADPYLYTVRSTLMDGSIVLDSVEQPLGLRTFRFDADNGFFLNGQHLKLHGVSRHQDALRAGWALSPEQHAQDMALIEELGANTVRQAHYQHADEWSELADRAGMVVWAELPYVTSPSLKGDKGSAALWANAEHQLREQIRQNYNHPSIVMWSVGNEVDSAKGFGQKGEPPKPLALLQHLNAVAKQEDPGRPTTMADCCEGLSMIATAGEKLAGTTDLIGYNRYFGWYYPKPLEAAAQLGQTLDKLHAEHPKLPISLSEYGAGGAITQHSDDVKSGFVNFIGRPHPEEYQAWVHEQSWPVLAERDFVFASWVWAMFDFSSDLRGEGDSYDLNDKGLVTADRKARKDAFWFYKAAWSDAPALHIAGKRYVDRAYPVMDVKAYANAPAAQLSLNGRPLGTAACVNFVCEWKRVPLRPGPNKAVVTASVGGKTVRDTTVWNGPAANAGIRIDAGNLAGRVIQGKRFGSDTFVSGGTPMVLNMGSFGGRSLGPERSVQTSSPELFDYWREGEAFSYAVPAANGAWKVTLHLFEPKADTTRKALTVSANGEPVIENLDVASAAGGPLRELVREFPVTVSDGVLRLDFKTSGGKTSVAAIELTR
ncbi:glycoside hydrolase family 2 TIM barrel-domain containing protein [Novosphingobium sp. M1R2S20]|uniref:Glycoside hydrolase family 2 TIM barrel-domain containing protein n=1 Tax=Novosphingobium rhizovicinum TaxID=3228928 RepID=A0ABV3RFC5_9SPHN